MGVMMDYDNVPSKAGDFDGDIEKGQVNVKLGVDFCNNIGELHYECGNYDGGLGSIKQEERVISSVGLSCGGGVEENVRLMVVNEERNGDVERKMVKEKPKAMSAKKPPKPPRPPRGSSLDLADQKLIRELYELAKLKRGRIERMKALKKAKEAKGSSLKNQLFATLLTVLFCIVLLFQGISSRTDTAASIQGSYISPGVADHNIITVQHYPVSSASNINGPGSESPRLVVPLSGVDTAEEVSRAVR